MSEVLDSNWCVVSAQCRGATISNISHLIFAPTLRNRYPHSHFTGEKLEAQNGKNLLAEPFPFSGPLSSSAVDHGALESEEPLKSL